jgi:hypothetical protein
MCCLFTVLVFLGPRAGILVWWLLQPLRWQTTFQNSWLWPLLGAIFVPWTTLMYVIVFPGGIVGFDWVWLGLALVFDIASYTGGAYGNRRRMPGYSG